MDDAKNRTKAVSLCTPAVRMMVLRAYAFQEDNGKLKQEIETIPVVALSARIYPEHDSLGYDVILCDDAYGIIALDDFKEFDKCYGAVHPVVELVTAPRPIEEDGRRLRKIMKALKIRARKEEDTAGEFRPAAD